MEPTIIRGGHFQDERGIINFNNDFNALGIKRVYSIQNKSTDFIRGWQGHKIEQRWFSAITGSFKIQLIHIDNWENPSKNLPCFEFILKSETFDILHIPGGYVTAIQALEEGSKLLLFADYQLGEIQDEYRFQLNYFI